MSQFLAYAASPMDIVRRSVRGLAPLALALLAACDSASAPAARPPVTLSFAAHATESNTVAEPIWLGSGQAFDIQVADGTHSLSITSVELVFDEIELELAGVVEGCDVGSSSSDVYYAGSPDATASSGSSDDCMEIESGPRLVDLPLGDGQPPVAAVEVSIPPGTYAELEMKLRPLDPSSGEDQRFLAAHPDFDGINLRVRGTFDGEAFEYAAALDDEIELEFRPALVVEEGGVNITVNLDVPSWFRGADGAVIDPRTAAAGQPNASVVRANIRRSLAVFEDDDHDGYDDHGGDGGRGSDD